MKTLRLVKLRVIVAAGLLFATSVAIQTPTVANKELTIDTIRAQSHAGDCSQLTSQQHNFSCSSASVDSCPAWFICNATENGSCLCGPQENGVLCDQQKLVSSVVNCYCVTRVENETYLGLCFYNCESPITNNIYQNEISDVASLNEFMCGRFHRTGISCGECKPGLHPYVLSYDLDCVPCSSAQNNWWKFAVYGLVPLTVFYFFVVFFNVNVTSSRLHGFILFSQALSTPALARMLFSATKHIRHLTIIVKVIELFFSLWNLDPLRSILPDICLNVSTLQSLALDACFALYPLFLMLLSYLCIELHDHNRCCFVAIWKPFGRLFRLLREKWDIRTSVIDSFATFFLLSYVKVWSVSVDLMLFTPVYELNSNRTHYRVYYDSNLLYLRGDHVPYAALSVFLFTFFTAMPTLVLMLYPFRCFQKFLSCFRIQWHFLHAFVDSFQGCYKDGTELGTCDLRWFSVYGLLLRILIGVVYVLTLSSMYFVYAVIVTVTTIILLINIQPYKRSVSHYTVIDASFLILLSLFYVSLAANNVTTLKGNKYLNASNGLAVVACVVPIIYIVSIDLHWIYSRRKGGKNLLRRMKKYCF